jgi:hypothetical protein
MSLRAKKAFSPELAEGTAENLSHNHLSITNNQSKKGPIPIDSV